jgi:hypothetical protein
MSLAKSDVNALLDPRLSLDDRYALYERYTNELKLQDMQTLINIMVNEFYVPDYLIDLHLSRNPNKFQDSPKKIHVHSTTDVAPETDDTPALPVFDYTVFQDICLTSEDHDGDFDDEDEIKDGLVNALNACQYPGVTEKNLNDFGPMNNDAPDVENMPKLWCHESTEGFIHGMYKCVCFLPPDVSDLEMVCQTCNSKIKSVKDAVRLPYGDFGGWHPYLYCDTECAVIDPPIEIDLQVRSKFLVGIEFMSRIK